MEDVKVLIVGEKLSNIPQIVNILEEIAKNGSPLLIICDDIDEITEMIVKYIFMEQRITQQKLRR